MERFSYQAAGVTKKQRLVPHESDTGPPFLARFAAGRRLR
jgi:hypothetical protein